MLVTGRTADGAFLRVYVPGPAVDEGWAPAAALEVDGDVAGLPTARCGGLSGSSSGEAAADFRVVADPESTPKPLGPPPGDQLIQLVSFDKDELPGRLEAAPWWSSPTTPRVELTTQFDGGPLQGSNAVPAAGAMLARLAFGIVATGSQLRALDADQEGGTSLASLVAALSDRWGYRLSAGYLSSDELRRLLASGAGAVIIVDYGLIPLDLHQQAGFSGAHAIYLDGYRPASRTDPAAYYVMDPMGQPWQGYHGDWWPADIVDRAATEFGGRRIAAAWAFAGGVNPAAPPSGAGPLNTPIGDDPSPSVPEGLDQILEADAVRGGFAIDPNLDACVESPVPDDCPAGVAAVYQPPASGLEPVPAPIGQLPIDLLYTDIPQPDVARVIFSAPAAAEPTFSYWLADGSGPVLRAEPEAATLGGKQVWMVTVPIPQAGATIYFMPSSSQGGVVNATEVGAISFGN
jgi:hypothetical protein